MSHEAFEDLLLLVNTPKVRRHDCEQVLAVCSASVKRQMAYTAKMTGKKLESNMGTPHHDSESRHKRRASQAFDSEPEEHGSTEIVRPLKVHISPSPLDQPRMQSHTEKESHALISLEKESNGNKVFGARPHGEYRIYRPTAIHTRTLRLRPTARVQHDIGELQKGISDMENRSLISMEVARGGAREGDPGDVVYTVTLELRPNPEENRDLVPHTEDTYNLLLDTGDAAIWFYARNFGELVKGTNGEEPTERPWSETVGGDDHRKHKMIPEGDADHVITTVIQEYVDGTRLRLKRWNRNYALPFRLPTWNWAKSQKDMRATDIKFPRILACSVTEQALRMPVDGSIGLAVPGFRQPWDDAQAADEVTFFDLLNNNTRTVETPMGLTIRLLPPDDYEQSASRCSNRTQSFLYFGKGVPCGAMDDQGKMLLPEFGPPLRIFPSEYAESEYQLWTLQLISMTLIERNSGVSSELEPLTPLTSSPVSSRSASPSAAESPKLDEFDQTNKQIWTNKGIGPNEGSRYPGQGLRVIFDTGSGCSVLPLAILKQMWTEWFEQSEKTPVSIGKPLWHNKLDHLADCDVALEFCDSGHRFHVVRCGAKEFLCSPWEGPAGANSTYSMFRASESYSDPNIYIMGQNFFWANMVKLNASPNGGFPSPQVADSAPTMQFAPQRVERDGEVIAGIYDIKVHPDLPPRLQAVHRCQPEIKSDA